MNAAARARLRVGAALPLAALLLAAGCAQQPVRTASTAIGSAQRWSGRLALKLDTEPAQSFYAGFELRGSAEAGELALFTPLGGTLAVLAWAPGEAQLRDGRETRRFDSLEALAAAVTGTALPVAALFDWLAGRPLEVPGWEADLSRLADGRLVALRRSPAPVAELRLALDDTKAGTP